ncbi:cytochrome c oxidase assembly protein [Sphingosinithalassobacter sp. CS137]|uniref:cytochrome c oxidase assembly protein n=1 Tax=Sphingosinithalassobacter sp. CS137 TaxID=2762748 RepID=UPI00165DC097|nr:cytochrome c oxidase assembly protein [Sphingosinithalassobacter sp. CS137]
MQIPYCGTPPVPAELLGRFNADPVLIAVLLLIAGLHLRRVARSGGPTGAVAAGWAVTAAALLSPLCALSVSLFSARVGQHMILALIAAPLIALGLPRSRDASAGAMLASGAAFAAALWLWHMPAPYAATFRSDLIYWTMHATLFGSAVLLWRDLVQHRVGGTFSVLALGGLTSVQMGLLGAILTFGAGAMFPVHYATTAAWGLSPLTDQQLGGLLMWVPGLIFFLVAAKRTVDAVFSADAAPHAP